MKDQDYVASGWSVTKLMSLRRIARNLVADALAVLTLAALFLAAVCR